MPCEFSLRKPQNGGEQQGAATLPLQRAQKLRTLGTPFPLRMTSRTF
jgi:hypothetical protein